jgi:tape measure domain-containing protein
MASKRFSVDAVFRGLDKISKPARTMGRAISKFVTQSNKQIAKLGARFKKLGVTITNSIKTGAKAAGVGIIGLGASIGLVVNEFSKLENAEAAFTPLLGGAEKAKKLVDELNKTAATTPFQFENLAGVANQLLPVMNGDIQNTIKTLRMMGDTAGGNAQKLETITRGFTKAMLKGKVDLESLNMIAEAGVPIFGELAKTMGTDVGEDFFKSISAGKIKTDDLIKTFERMTAKGGLFAGGMEIASRTTTGVISTMKDNVSLAAASIGKILAPTVKKYASKTTEAAKSIKRWIEANEDLIGSKINSFLNGLISVFTTMISVGKKVFAVLSQVAKDLLPPFKKLFDAFLTAARSVFPEFSAGTTSMKDVITVLVSALTVLATAGTEAFEFITFISPFLKPFIATLLVFKGIILTIGIVTKAWAVAQGIVNTVMAANPLGLIVIAIAAVVAAIVLLTQNWDTVVAAFKTGIDKTVEFFIFLWTKIKEVAGFIWTEFSKLLENPFFAAISTIFLPFFTVPALIIKHWEPIKVFFESIWKGLVSGFENAMSTITGLIKKIENIPGVKSVFKFLGIGDDEEKRPETEPKPVTPQERLSRKIEEETSRSIEEKNTTSTLTIKDQTGTAELSPQRRGGPQIALETSGGL